MQPNGKVLLAETLVPPGDEPDGIKNIDVVMLVVTGGLERTEAQYGQPCSAPPGYGLNG